MTEEIRNVDVVLIIIRSTGWDISRAALHVVDYLLPRLAILGGVFELDLVTELARVGAVLRVPALHVLLEMYHCKFILFEIHCTQLTTLVPFLSLYLIKKFLSNKTLAMELLIYLKDERAFYKHQCIS